MKNIIIINELIEFVMILFNQICLHFTTQNLNRDTYIEDDLH